MVDPVTLSGLIVAVISAIGVAILSICKVIKKSSCCFGVINVETRNDEVSERSELK
jgi:hypothetical protein